jgi:peptidoglycan hydrolase-like protein with peptidoglycan-binding domain
MRRILAVLAAIGCAACVSIVSAGPAAAAGYPTCNTTVAWVTENTSTWSRYEALQVPFRTGTGGTNVACNLKVGNSGSAVTGLQRALNKCYGRSLVVDGKYGTNTKNAVAYAQSVAGVVNDGVFGPATRSAIKWRTEKSGTYIGCYRVGYDG